MDSAHDRFESLAVGHVLGGLEASDAADFRGHLQACPACRRRVTELRGIADDLAAAERDERERARTRTATPVRAQPEDGEPRLPSVGVRALGVLVVATLVVVGLLGFWNLHLRTQVATAVASADRSDQTLVTLADGVALDAQLGEGVRGTVATDDARIAVVLAGVPVLEEDEVVIVWRLGGQDGPEAVLVSRPDDGRLLASLPIEDATGVLVTRQRVAVGDPVPGSDELARAGL